MLFRSFLIGSVLAMVGVAPTAHVDVQVERPDPRDPDKTQRTTVSVTFRAVDYRPVLETEFASPRGDDGSDGGERPVAGPVTGHHRRAAAPAGPFVPAPELLTGPSGDAVADVRAGLRVLPPPPVRARA